MPRENQKIRLLTLARLFFEETDEIHGLTLPQIQGKLLDFGVDVERKALYRDIAALQEFGYDVRKYQRSPVEYGLATRRFSRAELLMMVDAVQSSRFLTKTKSEDLVRSIKTLGSKHQAKDLTRRLYVEGRIKMQNESVFNNIDTIQAALSARRKIRFQYFKYNAAKEQKIQHNGDFYVETPVHLVFSDGCYYLVVFNDKHQGFAHYRVDRMINLSVSEERATRNEKIAGFDASEYQTRAFGMYGGSPVGVTLLVEDEAMGPVIDRFGTDVTTHVLPDGRARVHAMILESPTFYGWLAQFGKAVEIEGPRMVRQRYVEYIRGLLDMYE